MHRNYQEVTALKMQTSWFLFCAFICATVISIAHYGSKAVSVMAERSPLERQYTVIIDAGHGGEDGGALSPDGLPESMYNLSIALRLEKILHFLGLETQMIRNTDISVYSTGTTLAQKKRSDLKERVRFINQTENGLLLSIHQNSFPDKQYHGSQVFYAKTQGSKALAEEVQTALRTALNQSNKRQIKPASGIYLMEHIENPGILVECGFLSNPEEEHKLGSPEYQKKLCCVIAAVTAEFLEKGYANT